ncbi:hypothetical protein NPIL_24821 [Nephila pilipes]|uniref:Uncharacterized protein n=1 Tax=Nephila pilipes TaxID=299642 RepID=A0A8X6P1Z0_NEPPI|nr:hypothetical protein NPIL_24821 [Nephila pilipes]
MAGLGHGWSGERSVGRWAAGANASEGLRSVSDLQGLDATCAKGNVLKMYTNSSKAQCRSRTTHNEWNESSMLWCSLGPKQRLDLPVRPMFVANASSVYAICSAYPFCRLQNTVELVHPPVSSPPA